MPKSPVEVVRAILDNPIDLDTVKELVAPDATYVSLSYDNPDLKKLMPWAGTTRAAPKPSSETTHASAAIGRTRASTSRR